MQHSPSDLKDQLNRIPAPPPIKNLSSSPREEEDWLYNDEKRKDGMKTAVHNVFLYFIKFAFGSFVVILGIRLLHLILPLHCHWLEADQIQGIDKLVFSGAIGGFIGRHLNKITN